MENKDIVLVIIVIIVVYLLYKMNKLNESFTSTSISSGNTSSSPNSTSATAVEEDVVRVLDAHIISEVDRRITVLNNQTITDSIKNLGIIAKKIQDDGDFTFPTNLNVTGDFHVSGDINLPINNKLLPQGCILMWGQEEIPQGWVLCDGSAHLRKEFLSEESDELPLLFTNELFLQLNEAVRDKYIITPNLGGRFVLGSGAPDLVNNIPNDGGLVPTGYSDTTSYDVNQTSGERRHELTDGELAPHTHRLPQDEQGDTKVNVQSMIHNANHDERYNNDGNNTCPNCRGEAHNNMPPYHVLNYIMKVY